MEASGETLYLDPYASDNSMRRTLCPEPGYNTPEPVRWAYFHKPIIAMVMGALMSAVGAVLYLLHSSGVTEAPHGIAPACLSIGLMFMLVGLVWIPILKEKLRRRGLGQEAWTRSSSESSM